MVEYFLKFKGNIDTLASTGHVTERSKFKGITTLLMTHEMWLEHKALVLADMSQPVEDRFLIFDYRDCDHPMRLDG